MATIKSSVTANKVLLLTSLGGMLEFYDFTIYGFFSVYFAEQFFPSHDKLVAIMLSYTVFVIGYIARPIGGIIFSHIGDEIGRKVVMVITMLIMGFASIGIGLLPTYAQIGIAAPILLLLIRLSQGLAIGGEIPSAVVFITETMPQKSAYAIGIVMAGIGAGLTLGSAINAIITHTLSNTQLYDFGWRIPFIIGGLLCIIGYFIRRQLYETKVFTAEKSRPKFPLAYLFKHYPRLIIIGTGLGAIHGTSTMLAVIFMPTYLTKIIHTTATNIPTMFSIATILMICASYLTGIAANKFRPDRVMKLCLVWALIASCSSYYLLGHNVYIFAAIIAISTLPGIFSTLSALFMSKIFPAEIRLTGLALSYNLGHTIFGGLAPIIITALIDTSGYKMLIPASYFVVVIALSFTATVCAMNYLKPQ